MKILFILSQYPYEIRTGPEYQTYRLIKYMSEKHECHVIGFYDPTFKIEIDHLKQTLPEVEILCLLQQNKGLSLHAGRLKNILALKPVFLARWSNPSVYRTIKEITRMGKYDLIHIEGIPMVQYLSACKHVPTIMSTIDAISKRYKQAAHYEGNIAKKLYLIYAGWAIKRLESRELSKATTIHVVAESEKYQLEKSIPETNIRSIGIVVPDELMHRTKNSFKEPTETCRLFFSGDFGQKNISKGLIWYLEDVFPKLLRNIYKVEVTILGRNPTKRLRRLIGQHDNVKYITWVDDYFEELGKADIVIFPDFEGTGIKNRVIQAMALAKAILGRPESFNGIPALDGEHCIMSETQQDFLDASVELACNVALRERIGRNARDLILNNFTIDVIGPMWEKLYLETINIYQSQIEKNGCGSN